MSVAKFNRRKAFWARIAALLCVTLAVAGCNRPTTTNSSARSYEVRGIVRGFAPDRSTVSIEHEDIPGFMPAMTMPFSVKNPNEITGLKIGDAISFRTTVTDKDLFLDQVKKLPASDVHAAEPTPTANVSDPKPCLGEGDILPPFNLTNQDGARVTAETFRGRPWALTFIFTRCAVPTFCPLISRNFAELQEAIKADAALAERARLLSITLDPQFDTAAVLKNYAQNQDADPQIWTFATGEPAEIARLTQDFAVQVQPAEGTIAHGLATALIGADGKVVRIWRGNAWTPGEVLAELRKL